MLQGGGCPLRAAPFLLYTFPLTSISYGCFQRLSFSIWRWYVEKKRSNLTAAPLQKRSLLY